MKRKLLIAVAVTAVLMGLVAAPALAGGGPDRYQIETMSYRILVLGTYVHDYVVTTNPCDGTVTITGATPVGSWYYTTERITGTLILGVVSFSSTCNGPHNPGYSWSGSFPVIGGALAGQYTGTVGRTGYSVTNYKNHGQYVKAMGGGADAAHSCIGMPIQSRP